MRLVLHIVAKDLRRHGPWILAMAVALGAQIILAWWAAEQVLKHSTYDIVLRTHSALMILELILSYVLALLWVQDDAVVGAQVFWRTRPISKWRLFGAKAAGLALVTMFLPTLISIPWWLHGGFGWGDVALAAGELFTQHAAVVLPAILVAVCTDTFGRALLWNLVPASLALVLALWWVATFGRASIGLELRAGAVVLLMIAAAVVSQFLLQRLAITIALLAIGIGLTPFIAQAWWRLTRIQPFTEYRADMAANITAEFEEVKINPPGSRAKDRTWMHTAFAVHGRPSDVSWNLARADLVLSAEDGSVLRTLTQWTATTSHYRPPGVPGPINTALRLGAPAVDEETERWNERWHAAILASRSAILRTGPPRKYDWLATEMPVTPSVAARIANERCAFEARLGLVLSKPEILNEFPLKPGGSDILIPRNQPEPASS